MKSRLLVIPVLLSVSFFFSFTNLQAQNGANTQPVTLQEALEQAAEEDKKILVDVYATWCPYCKRMHTEVYTDDGVLQAISEHFIWVKIDVESENTVNYLGNEMTEAEFASALDNKNVPTTYFLNREGSIIGVQPGFITEETFSSLLNFVGSDAYLNQSFEEYNNEQSSR